MQYLPTFERPASYGERNDSQAAMDRYLGKLAKRVEKSKNAAPIVAKVYEGPVYNPGAYSAGPKY